MCAALAVFSLRDKGDCEKTEKTENQGTEQRVAQRGGATIRVAGLLTPGTRIVPSNERVTLPADRIAPGEIVYRLGTDMPDLALAMGDLLIVEPRQHASTGELVIATLQERAFLGRWWTKHGTRKLLDSAFEVIADAPELLVAGAVTLIAREQTTT